MKKPNFDEMTRDEAIKLLKEIRNMIGCEDSDLLGVDQRVGDDNELS